MNSGSPGAWLGSRIANLTGSSGRLRTCLPLLSVLFLLSAQSAADKRSMFEGPPLARKRFLQGKEVPLVCTDTAGVQDNNIGSRKNLGPEDEELVDASAVVADLFKVVGEDVILTRENLETSWVKKLELDIYEWEIGSLPPTLRIALGGKTRFKSCALVGSSGHLSRTSFGHIIDKFDAVGRANQSPIKGYEEHAGSKTTMRFVNEAIGRQYREASRKNIESLCREGINKMVREERLGRSAIKYTKWSYPLEQGVMLTQVSEQKSVPKSFMELQHNMKLLRQDVKLLMVPNIMTHMTYHSMENWADRMVCSKFLDTKTGARPTTGFQMAMVMLKLCHRVVLYGFGPSAKGEKASSYHFFNGTGARTWRTTSSKVHNFRAEFLFFKSLASKGLITICDDESEADCGISDIEAAENATMPGEPLQVAPGHAMTVAAKGRDGGLRTRQTEHEAQGPAGYKTAQARRNRLGLNRRGVSRLEKTEAAVDAPAEGHQPPSPQNEATGPAAKKGITVGAFLSKIRAALGSVKNLSFADE